MNNREDVIESRVLKIDILFVDGLVIEYSVGYVKSFFGGCQTLLSHFESVCLIDDDCVFLCLCVPPSMTSSTCVHTS